MQRHFDLILHKLTDALVHEEEDKKVSEGIAKYEVLPFSLFVQLTSCRHTLTNILLRCRLIHQGANVMFWIGIYSGSLSSLCRDKLSILLKGLDSVSQGVLTEKYSFDASK